MAAREPIAGLHFKCQKSTMNSELEIVDLHAMLEVVVDEDSFLSFVEELGRDFCLERKLEAENPSPPYMHGKLGWENGSIDTFLDAATAWGRNSSEPEHPGYRETNPWRRCANILYAGKYYE